MLQSDICRLQITGATPLAGAAESGLRSTKATHHLSGPKLPALPPDVNQRRLHDLTTAHSPLCPSPARFLRRRRRYGRQTRLG